MPELGHIILHFLLQLCIFGQCVVGRSDQLRQIPLHAVQALLNPDQLLLVHGVDLFALPDKLGKAPDMAQLFAHVFIALFQPLGV